MKPAGIPAPIAPVPQPGSKSGTTIVKSAPPKETARITVKPNLPTPVVKAGGNFPTAKPAAGAVPVVAAAAAGAVAGAVAAQAAKPSGSAKPATTIVKTGTAKVVATPKAAAGATPAAAPAVVSASQFQEEASTTLTTILSGVLAVLTWGTAVVLGLNFFGML